MKIKFKEGSDIKALNKSLVSHGINSKISIEKYNIEWLWDINRNPNSPQRHLKPKDKDLTMDELKGMFKDWTEVDVVSFDLYFGRTSMEVMKAIPQFLKENEESVAYITDSELLIERGELKDECEIKLLKKLQLIEDVIEPEIHPEDVYLKQKELKSGLMLCKSYSINPFWVLFGKTKRSQGVSFLKEKKYIDDSLNNLYRDDNGYGFMLIPLYDFSEGFFDEVYQDAYNMGLREHPLYFMTMIYRQEMVDGAQVKVSEEFLNWYSPEEIIERLSSIMKASGFEGKEIKFDSVNHRIVLSSAQRSDIRYQKLIDSFLVSLKKLYGEIKECEINDEGIDLKFETKNIIIAFA